MRASLQGELAKKVPYHHVRINHMRRAWAAGPRMQTIADAVVTHNDIVSALRPLYTSNITLLEKGFRIAST